MAQQRALGVIRVSEVGDRDERLSSPEDQQDRIGAICGHSDYRLLDTFREIDISGGSDLARRPGLLRAVEEVEAGRADIIVVAYFDRLVRSIKVQHEVVSRVEAAGGKVLAADFGEISGETAVKWLSSSVIGVVSEYLRRSTGERVAVAQRRAVEQFNRPPFPLIPGLRRMPDGSVELDPIEAPLMRRAFEMRADGATLREVHAFLNDNGIHRASLSTRALGFRSPLAVGRIEWGDYRGACPALVDDDLFERVQRLTGRRGRLAKSPRLLARLDVVRCQTCGSRMSVQGGSPRPGTRYWSYVCKGITCNARAAISAPLVEGLVITEVKRLCVGIRGHATTGTRARELRAVADRDQAALDKALRVLADFDDEPAAMEQARKLRDARDSSRDAAAKANRGVSTLEISVGKDWDDLTFAEQRDLVQALIESVSVAPGRGLTRVQITPITTHFE